MGLGLGVLGVLILLSLSGIVGALCWPYAINSWLVFLGKNAVVVWWQGFLLGYVPGIGQLSIPVAIATWIILMFVS